MVGLTRFELVTPRLSSVCSNQLSYRPQRSCDEVSRVKELDFGFGFVPTSIIGLPAVARSAKAGSFKTE